MPKSRSMNFVLRSVQMMHSENSIERQLSENYLGSRHLNQKQNCCQTYSPLGKQNDKNPIFFISNNAKFGEYVDII